MNYFENIFFFFSFLKLFISVVAQDIGEQGRIRHPPDEGNVPACMHNS